MLMICRLALGCALLGLTTAGVFPVWAALLGDCYSETRYGTVMGTMNLVMLPMNLGLVYFVGWSFDRDGNYQTAFGLFVALLVLSLYFVRSLKRPDAELTAG